MKKLVMAVVLWGLTAGGLAAEEPLPLVVEHYSWVVLIDEVYHNGEHTYSQERLYFIRGDQIVDSRSYHSDFLIYATNDGTFCVTWSDYAQCDRLITFDKFTVMRGDHIPEDPQQPWWAANRQMRALKAP